MKAAIIGDIHGAASQLERLLAAPEISGRRLIFLGDYINGRNNSRAVLDLLVDLSTSSPGKHCFLMGNHELALLDYIASGALGTFARMGGLETLSAYLSNVHGDVGSAFMRVFPSTHHRFLESLRACWEGEGMLISHTGFDPTHPEDRSMNAMARQSHPSIFAMDMSQYSWKLVVCGHYAQRTQKPYVSDNLICIDTGCGTHGGPLTALLMPEKSFVSV